MAVLVVLSALFNPRVVLLAQLPSPTSEKSKVDLLRDIQSPEGDVAGPEAVKLAVQRHDLEVLTAGLVGSRIDVRKLCLLNLDSFSQDQQKVALSACLLSKDGWRPDRSGQVSTFQFHVNSLLTEKLQHFGVSVQPVDLWKPTVREAAAQRIHPTSTP